MTDAAQNQEDVNNIRQTMKSAKGPGMFRNLFMYSPNSKKDGIKIIPMSEVAAKDEFLNLKNVSRNDMMTAHRVQPQMIGIMPSEVGGFRDVKKARKIFVRKELNPLQMAHIGDKYMDKVMNIIISPAWFRMKATTGVYHTPVFIFSIDIRLKFNIFIA